MPSYLVYSDTHKHLKAAAVVISLTQVFLAAAVIGLAATTFLQPDPLAVVTQVLEEFSANQTAILADHLAQVNHYLSATGSLKKRLYSVGSEPCK